MQATISSSYLGLRFSGCPLKVGKESENHVIILRSPYFDMYSFSTKNNADSAWPRGTLLDVYLGMGQY